MFGCLRTHIAARLPSYMVPTTFCVVERFEVTGSGKIDYGALQLPAIEARPVSELANPVEQSLAEECGACFVRQRWEMTTTSSSWAVIHSF